LEWDLTGANRAVPRRELPVAGPSQALVASSDASYAVSVSGPDLEFVDLDSEPAAVTRVLSGHSQVWILAWHPLTEHRLFTAGDDGIVREWDARTGEVRAQHRVSTTSVRALTTTPDGSGVVFGSIDGSVGLLDLASGDVVSEANVDDQIVAVASGDDRTVALVVPPRVVAVDLHDGATADVVALDFVPIRAEFSPDGRRLAVVGAGGETGLLDADSGKWIREPATVHDDTAFSAAFSPDGRSFATGGLDGQLVLWDGATGAAIAATRAGSATSTLVPTVLDDGTTIVAGSTDGSIYRWPTDTASLVVQACGIARRELSAGEWFDAVGDREQRPTCT
jgi:WD40 repeat protein